MLEQGGELPLEWVLEGSFGSKGGAEKAFMSTSMNREEAAKYAARGVNPTLLQLRLGQVRLCLEASLAAPALCVQRAECALTEGRHSRSTKALTSPSSHSTPARQR